MRSVHRTRRRRTRGASECRRRARRQRAEGLRLLRASAASMAARASPATATGALRAKPAIWLAWRRASTSAPRWSTSCRASRSLSRCSGSSTMSHSSMSATAAPASTMETRSGRVRRRHHCVKRSRRPTGIAVAINSSQYAAARRWRSAPRSQRGRRVAARLARAPAVPLRASAIRAPDVRRRRRARGSHPPAACRAPARARASSGRKSSLAASPARCCRSRSRRANATDGVTPAAAAVAKSGTALCANAAIWPSRRALCQRSHAQSPRLAQTWMPTAIATTRTGRAAGA